ATSLLSTSTPIVPLRATFEGPGLPSLTVQPPCPEPAQAPGAGFPRTPMPIAIAVITLSAFIASPPAGSALASSISTALVGMQGFPRRQGPVNRKVDWLSPLTPSWPEGKYIVLKPLVDLSTLL